MLQGVAWSRDPPRSHIERWAIHGYLGPSSIILLLSTSSPQACLYRREQDKYQGGQYINVK